jgi:AcrR family transcriptional regulator
MATVGLREQKKAETREAISLAAVRLTEEFGLDAVTGEAIAEAAHVAPRTFRNYFPNKEAAILHAVDMLVDHFLEFLRQRYADEPILDSLEAAAVALVESPHEIDRVLTVRRLTRENRALRVHWAINQSTFDLGAVTEEIARRTKTKPHRDVYPRVVTLAAWGVITAALDMQTGTRTNTAKLVERVHIGFASLGHGLAHPLSG